MTQGEESGTSELREDAAMWFALMRGPEAEAKRAEFDAWLGADPAHRKAYSHIAEVFSLGKGLKAAPAPPDAGARVAVPKPGRLARMTTSPLVLTLLVVGCVPVLLGLTVLAMRAIGPAHPLLAPGEPSSAASLATTRGEVRSFKLEDGSRVILDADSRVRVVLSARRRDLILLRGRARFFVAHEPRPFVVFAGGGAVVARGTVFDVALLGDSTTVVDLIEGVVDVRPPPGSSAPPDRRRVAANQITRLTAGSGLRFGPGIAESPRVVLSGRIDWPSDLREFKDVPLRDLVAEANRYADKPLVLAQADLGELRVSGTFRLREPARLAGNLAELLELSLVESPSGLLLARRCANGKKEFCRPAS